MKELHEFVEMSRYAGERFDLIQAGGGNTSVKLPSGKMLIKASGFPLSEVNSHHGYSTVLTQQVMDVVDNPEMLKAQDKRTRESMAGALLNEATIDKARRPSIETLLHSLLPKYVLHTHPILVNVIAARKNWREIFDNLFPESISVSYTTPGVDLAIAMQIELRHWKEKHPFPPKLVFLQNHGLIVASDTFSEITYITEQVLQKIEWYLAVPASMHKLTTGISGLLRKVEPDHEFISFLSEDAFLAKANRDLFSHRPFTPDILVFCGVEPLRIFSLDDVQAVTRYKQQFGSLPKVILFEDHIFCIALNVKKAREVEEVLKFQVMTLGMNKLSDVNFLDEQELSYLSNWEAEKFRQKL